jgi:hypothetical protein
MNVYDYGSNSSLALMDTTQRTPPQVRSTYLSREDRLYIFRTVSALVSLQFNELVFSLNPPKGLISESASQGDRCQALLNWVESPTGPGLKAVDDHLKDIIPKSRKVSKELKCITIPVDFHSLTTKQLTELIENIERITGVEVDFSEEGSIKLFVSGSEEDLGKLQELYESGDLSKHLGGIPIQSINTVDSDSTEARKARFGAALRLSSASTLDALASARNLDALALASALASALDASARNLDALARDLDLDRDGLILDDLALDVALDDRDDLILDDLARDDFMLDELDELASARDTLK